MQATICHQLALQGLCDVKLVRQPYDGSLLMPEMRASGCSSETAQAWAYSLAHLCLEILT